MAILPLIEAALRLHAPACALVFFLGSMALPAGEVQDSTRRWPGSSRTTTEEASGPVVQLQKRIDAGETQLRFEPDAGYLLTLLDELGISRASQLLVFSRTSCQRDRISPRNPRAIYFNDRAYIAYIPGSPLLEVSCVEPKAGAVFYSLEQKEAARPQLVRRDLCLECHTSNKTLGIPGYLVRSYATDGNGVVDITDGCSMVDHRTPFQERWGGWYICGTAVTAHRGNLISDAAPVKGGEQLLAQAKALPRSAVDLSKYPHPGSDLVALMVLEHQAHMQNLIIRLAADAQRAGVAGLDVDKGSADALLKYMLFVEETPLSKPIQGGPAFATWFEGQGPRDAQARSLRKLDLRTRLFKYPCSYMVYSDSFDALPRRVKLHLYHRLWKILKGEDADPVYGRIAAPAKQAILEILTQTKLDLPIDWQL